jgi:hypothetical protein
MATIAIAGCGGSGNPASEAKTYVRTISPNAAQVQADEIKVGLDILHNDLTSLAQDAQTAHDDFANNKIDIIGAGSNVGDNSRLGNAEYQMEDAINELKNGMGAVVAFAENPSAGTLGAAGSKLDQGVTDWDQAATVLWTMAGRASEIPSLAGSTSATTNSNTATTPATTPNPATSSVPSWVQAARSGCPAGEVLLKTLSNGQPAPYGNDGCVSNGGPYECSPSEPTCDPANAPGVTPTTQTTTTQTTAPAPQSYGYVRCPNATLKSGGQAKVAIVSGPATCSEAERLVSDAIGAQGTTTTPQADGMWSWHVGDYTCTSGGDGTISTCVGGRLGVQASKIIGTTPTPGGYWPDPVP